MNNNQIRNLKSRLKLRHKLLRSAYTPTLFADGSELNYGILCAWIDGVAVCTWCLSSSLNLEKIYKYFMKEFKLVGVEISESEASKIVDNISFRHPLEYIAPNTPPKTLRN